MKMYCKIALMLLASSFLGISYASQVGRYMTLEHKPQKSQVDLLSQVVQVRFPQTVHTVGDGIVYLLRFSGYRLLPKAEMSQALLATLNQPLPIIDRGLGPVSLKDGLITLAGPTFYLVQDPINRVVNFNLKPRYQPYLSNKNHLFQKV